MKVFKKVRIGTFSNECAGPHLLYHESLFADAHYIGTSTARSFLFLIVMLKALNQLIEDHGDGAQNDDGGDDHIELKEMESASEMDRHPIVLWR